MPYADPKKRLERGRRYRAKYRKEINERRNQKRAEDPEKARAYARQYRAENLIKVRAYGRKYMRKVAELPDPTRPEPKYCECCAGLPNGNTAFLHLDHCHVTGRFRGWLCSSCNTGIGQLGDNLDGVYKALFYLQRYSPRVIFAPDLEYAD